MPEGMTLSEFKKALFIAISIIALFSFSMFAISVQLGLLVVCINIGIFAFLALVYTIELTKAELKDATDGRTEK